MLVQARKTGVMNQITKPLGGAMVDLLFDAGDADIEDEETDGIIAAAVDKNKSAVAIQHAKHFTERLVLVGVVMEGIAAGNDVKAVIIKGQVFGISDHKSQAILQVEDRHFLLGVFDHIGGHIESNGGLDVRSVQKALDEEASGTAAYIQDAEVVESPSLPMAQSDQHASITGAKQEIVDDGTVVVMRPTLKVVMGGFFPLVSLGRIFAHGYTRFQSF